MTRALSNKTLIAFYGDDFTGSSSVMEVLSFAGLNTVLFLNPPTPQQLAQFREARCIGIAGVARSWSPLKMEQELPAIYDALKSLKPSLIHYKTCSTFDSSPSIGSIGKAIDLFNSKSWIPLMVAAPAIGRFQAYGNLFARVGETTHRLDRHPVMALHPVTPMDEADLTKHLSRQTNKKIGLIDLSALKNNRAKEVLERLLNDNTEIISLDCVDNETLIEVGRLIWEENVKFAVGSQGVDYALVAFWQSEGLLPQAPKIPKAKPMEQIAAVSASLSPITAEQIENAAQNGFTLIHLNAANPDYEEAFQAALKTLNTEASPLIYTSKTKSDAQKLTPQQNDDLGKGLGLILDRITKNTNITRLAIAGGDTSGHAMQQLGVYALEAFAPLQAGAPLMKVHRDKNTLEIVLKGGQIGQRNFFSAVRNGEL